MTLSDRNKQWLADRLIESKSDNVKAAQEKYVRESLSRAMNEVREAHRSGGHLQDAKDFLKEMETW